jgi:uncharacterized membrane protein YsdA (DUF1294 family)
MRRFHLIFGTLSVAAFVTFAWRYQASIHAVALLAYFNLVVFCFYGWDKMQAITHGRRIREATFHVLSLFGGWSGAFVGQVLFRHKTAKPAFFLVHWASAAITAMGVYMSWRYGN